MQDNYLKPLLLLIKKVVLSTFKIAWKTVWTIRNLFYIWGIIMAFQLWLVYPHKLKMEKYLENRYQEDFTVGIPKFHFHFLLFVPFYDGFSSIAYPKSNPDIKFSVGNSDLSGGTFDENVKYSDYYIEVYFIEKEKQKLSHILKGDMAENMYFSVSQVLWENSEIKKYRGKIEDIYQTVLNQEKKYAYFNSWYYKDSSSSKDSIDEEARNLQGLIKYMENSEYKHYHVLFSLDPKIKNNDANKKRIISIDNNGIRSCSEKPYPKSEINLEFIKKLIMDCRTMQ